MILFFSENPETEDIVLHEKMYIEKFISLQYREAMFRETTETISRRVLLWMVGETALLIVIALWQVENLKKFFESKKMV